MPGGAMKHLTPAEAASSSGAEIIMAIEAVMTPEMKPARREGKEMPKFLLPSERNAGIAEAISGFSP